MADPKPIPQALVTTYPTRLSTFNTALITPVLAPLTATPSLSRVTKRGTTIVNYAELEDDDDDIFEDHLDRRRGRGTPTVDGIVRPTVVGDGIQRVTAVEGKEVVRPQITHFPRSQAQIQGAATRPERLIPIRLDLEIDSNRRLKDQFLWNLHESLITPEEFAAQMVADLQLPPFFANQIAASIRTQLEEYAPVAAVDLPEGETFPIIVSLSIHLRNSLFTDKFEWDLANSNASCTPENFASLTCADMALAGEFRPAISHAIYEATMKSKKEILETAGTLPDTIDNDAAFDLPAGWRVSTDLCEDWGPKVEALSREEVEKREGDRDRELRRLRRESSRFGIVGGWEEEGLGRGERKRKKKGRSPSPAKGGGAGGSSVTEWERQNWSCSWCQVRGSSTWAIRDGPAGPRTLCSNCSSVYTEDGVLPVWMKDLHKNILQQPPPQRPGMPQQQHSSHSRGR